jgi:hypothetical protein
MQFNPGQKAIFNYPGHGSTVMFPEHVAHSGLTVTIDRSIDEVESVEPMYVVHADDGWTAEVFESELTHTAH